MTTITGSEQHTASRIPMRNIWMLMLYASDLFRQLGRNQIAVEDNPAEIPDLWRQSSFMRLRCADVAI